MAALTVVIRAAVLDELVAHARAEAPLECCGLLIGTHGRITAAHRARNLLRSPSRYQIDPRDHFAALRASRGAGSSVVGAYHSHPRSSPEPSPTDLAEADAPDFVHLIVGLAPAGSQTIRAYLLSPGAFTPLRLVTVS